MPQRLFWWGGVSTFALLVLVLSLWPSLDTDTTMGTTKTTATHGDNGADDTAARAEAKRLRSEKSVDECIRRIREAGDYGETGMDTTLAAGVTARPIADADEAVFTRWSREGADRGVPEWVLDDAVAAGEAGSGGVRILFLHGGGYAYYSPSDVYRPFSTRLAKATGAAVLAIDYRKVPEAIFPAQVDDAVKALAWVWENGPDGPSRAEKVFLVGDSAGGGLVISTMLAAITSTLDGVQSIEPVQAPTGGVVISAYTDLTCSLPSYRTRVWKEADKTGDPVFSQGDPVQDTKDSMGTGREYVGPDGDWSNPIASSVFAKEEWLKQLPPLLLMVGDAEV